VRLGLFQGLRFGFLLLLGLLIGLIAFLRVYLDHILGLGFDPILLASHVDLPGAKAGNHSENDGASDSYEDYQA